MYMGIRGRMALQRVREELRSCPQCGEILLDMEKKDVRQCLRCQESHDLIGWMIIKYKDLLTQEDGKRGQ